MVVSAETAASKYETGITEFGGADQYLTCGEKKDRGFLKRGHSALRTPRKRPSPLARWSRSTERRLNKAIAECSKNSTLNADLGAILLFLFYAFLR